MVVRLCEMFAVESANKVRPSQRVDLDTKVLVSGRRQNITRVSSAAERSVSRPKLHVSGRMVSTINSASENTHDVEVAASGLSVLLRRFQVSSLPSQSRRSQSIGSHQSKDSLLPAL